MSAARPPAALSPRLESAIKALPDPAFAWKLRSVYAAGAQAISRLSDMDLMKYETDVTDDAPDLSLWEEMAPVIRDTVVDVNGLLSVIRELFPPRNPSPLPAGHPLAARAQAAVGVLHEAMNEIAAGITALGEAMRSPQVVSDRWNLLAEIQRFRSRFRHQIGELVHRSITVFGDVPRAEVVPGHEEEVRSAVTVLAIVSDLSRVVTARAQKVREADDEDVQWHAQQLQNELDAFGRTNAYKALRAQDKRHVLEIRAAVGRLAIRPSAPKDELVQVVGGLEGLVRGLAAVNQRQILVDHDREMMASCGVRLERAAGLVPRDPTAAARALAEAAAAAQSLYGRDAPLDTFLRRARKTSLAQLTGAELRGALEEFQNLLASQMLA